MAIIQSKVEMKAQKGEWFSLRWDIVDFYDPESFVQYSAAPRFLYAEEDSNQIEGDVINEFDRIRLMSIFMTTVFILEENGVKLPTHYIPGEFGPGDRPKYDAWLAEYHKIHYTVSERIHHKEELQQKHIFLDHTAKVIRHDMHSGINQYIPRGIKGLVDKLPASVIKKHKLETSLRLLQEGIQYTQQVYQDVYAFTNLVKGDEILEMEDVDLTLVLTDFLKDKAYGEKVNVAELPTIRINKYLFCVALGNLIKGGLQFNESETKWVKVYMGSPDVLCVHDNGVGLSREEFISYCKPYVRLKGVDEATTKIYQGLELNIAVAIIEDHGFHIEPEKLELGTIFRINLNRSRKHLIDNRRKK